MASMTSVISFIVLLFATYSYSIPVVQQFNGTVPVYPFLNNGTMLQNITSTYNGSVYYPGYNNASNGRYQSWYTNYSHVGTATADVTVSPRAFGELESEETTTYGEMTVTPRSMNSAESGETTTYGDITVTPRSIESSESGETTTYGEMTVTPRSIGDSESGETTTYGEMKVTPRSIGESESGETTTYGDVTVTPRSIGESSGEENTTSSDMLFSPRSFYASEFTSSTPYEGENFNERAIPSFGEQEYTSSTPLNARVQGEMSQNVQPSSSVTKFGQSSGLFSNVQTAAGLYVQAHPAGQLGSQLLTQGQRVSQPAASNQVPTGQLYVQQPVSQILTKTQQIPSYIQTNRVPVSQVSGQQTGSPVFFQGQQSVPQFSSQGQRVPQSVGMTQVQGGQSNVVVSTTPSEEFGTDADGESTTVRGFRQTTVTRRV